jgi:hypothetical protein
MNSNIDDLPELIRILDQSVDVVEVIHPIIYSQEMVPEHLNTDIEHAKISCMRVLLLPAGRA